MENKRKITILIHGDRKELRASNSQCQVLASLGAIAWDEECEITVIDREAEHHYSMDDMDTDIQQSLEVDDWMEEQDCVNCEEWSLKSCASAEIELDEDDQFDISKLVICYQEWIYHWGNSRDYMSYEDMISGIEYDGKQYELKLCDQIIDSEHAEQEEEWDLYDRSYDD